MAELRWEPADRVKPKSTYLSVARRNVASRTGEDGILGQVFSIIGSENRFCVEFGAWDGRHLSNSWNLIANRGWGGVLIEGDDSRFATLKGAHGGNERLSLVNRFVGLAAADDLDALFAETDAPEAFDLLSIDVDGID